MSNFASESSLTSRNCFGGGFAELFKEKINYWLGAVLRGLGQNGLSRELCGRRRTIAQSNGLKKPPENLKIIQASADNAGK